VVGWHFWAKNKASASVTIGARELAATGASTVAAACPFCNTMFRDALTAVSPRRRNYWTSPKLWPPRFPGRVRFYEHARCVAACLFLLTLEIVAAPPATKAPRPKPAPLTAEQRATQALMKPMSLREKVAQLVIVNANGDVYSTKSPDYEKYRHWVADLHVGGIIINNISQYGLSAMPSPTRWPYSSTRCRGWRRRRCWSPPISSGPPPCALPAGPVPP